MSTNRRKKTYTLLALMVVFSSLGNILLSKGMKGIGEIRDYSPVALESILTKTFTSGAIWLGIASLLVFFICNLLVLSWADYSFVQPASAIGYAVVALLGYLLLGELVSPMRWLGVGLISAGVALVGGTEPDSRGAAEEYSHGREPANP
jgi:drug/metabolite transporter (DMT)-like permease